MIKDRITFMLFTHFVNFAIHFMTDIVPDCF